MNTLRREKTADAVEIVEEIIREDDLDQSRQSSSHPTGSSPEPSES